MANLSIIYMNFNEFKALNKKYDNSNNNHYNFGEQTFEKQKHIFNFFSSC